MAVHYNVRETSNSFIVTVSGQPIRIGKNEIRMGGKGAIVAYLVSHGVPTFLASRLADEIMSRAI